jgi:HAAS domain-containing protein
VITDYLLDLHAELRMPRRRRARALAEVEDHLLCSAAEMRAGGLPLADAEARAVDAFGDPGELGRALTAVDGRRYTVRAGFLSLPLGIAAGWLGLRGALGLGAPMPIALTGFVLAQVALVAGGLTAFRAWLVRRGGDPALRVLVRRGSALVAGCLLVVAGCAATTAARHGTALTVLAAGLLVCSAGLLIACAGALRRAFGSPDPASVGPDHDVLREVAPLLGAATVARLERCIGLARRPWRFAWAVGLVAGLALAVAHGVGDGGLPDLAHLPRAAVAGVILAGAETFSTLAGFLVLGRWLGIRPARG